MLIVIVCGLAAGICFAAGGVLQQSEASREPDSESLSPHLIGHLLRRPTWLAGIGVDVLSYGFKSVALAYGPLSIVQPLAASEVIFAVPVSVRRHHHRLHAREWAAAAAVAAGLAIGIYAADPRTGNPLPPLPRWGEALGAVLVIVAGGVAAGRRLTGSARASLYALAAAALLAAQGALMAATVALFKQGIVTAFASWQPYAMAVAAISGMGLVQSAYQAGPLAASLPVIDAVNPVVAIGIGVVIFGEHVQSGAIHLVGTAVGLALLFGGIVALDTSPLVRRVEREEEQERDEAQEAPDGDEQHRHPAGAP